MGWLIALGVLTVLAILPVGVRALYNTQGPWAWLLIGPLRFRLYPGKKKDKKAKKEPEPEEKKLPQGKPGDKKTGGSWKDFVPLVQTILDFLGDLRRKLRVRRLEMKLILAGDDPCDLAVNYGKAWAALGNLMPHLEKLFVIKKRDLEVACDFTSDQTLIYARMDVTITLGRLVVLVSVYGIRAVRQYLNIMKTRKGGAKK